MGKRTPGQFERAPRDLYDTPEKAALPLLPFLPANTRYIEPCFGNGRLAETLNAAGHVCVGGFDIEPLCAPVKYADATDSLYDVKADAAITNPPWRRELLHKIILNLSPQLRTFLLFDMDWIATKQAQPYIPMCRTIIAVGRVRWIEGSASDGKDNAAWYEFSGTHNCGPIFIGRRD